ncbi:MAG TPA: hypothetical protein VK817_13465 [Trebonia sp.]|nr:hypothetical protein [Trebonia sp.]
MPSDRVTEATEELYAADPVGFMERRKALADAARADGDKEAAKRITALRKPTRAAWILNHLARADPDAPGRLETLASSLRAATRAKDGRRLRELSADRGALIDALTSQALSAAGVADPPPGLREDVAATLTSALADPDTAGQFAAGTLTRAAQWAGFGLAPAPDGPDDGDSPDDGVEPATATASGSGARAEPKGTGRALTKTPASSREQPRATPPRAAPVRESPRPAPAAAPAATRTAPHREPPSAKAARARDAEDAAVRRRKAFADAKRSLAIAMKAASAAGSAEDQLEATVRDLEQRLTKARADLADARLRARRAEAAERKASQALDRLPHP